MITCLFILILEVAFTNFYCHWFYCAMEYVQIENRSTDLESRMGLANTQIEELISKHIMEENAKMAELEEQLKWYQKELNLQSHFLSGVKK